MTALEDRRFIFNVFTKHMLSTAEVRAQCAGPIADFAISSDAYSEFFFTLDINQNELIKWIQFLNDAGLPVLYCGVVNRHDVDEGIECHLCVVHNEILAKEFPNLTLFAKLNLMITQALRFIEYYPEIVQYSYEIDKVINDKFLSIQLAHLVLEVEKGSLESHYFGKVWNNYLHETFSWFYIHQIVLRLITLEQLKSVKNISLISRLFDKNFTLVGQNYVTTMTNNTLAKELIKGDKSELVRDIKEKNYNNIIKNYIEK